MLFEVLGDTARRCFSLRVFAMEVIGMKATRTASRRMMYVNSESGDPYEQREQLVWAGVRAESFEEFDDAFEAVCRCMYGLRRSRIGTDPYQGAARPRRLCSEERFWDFMITTFKHVLDESDDVAPWMMVVMGEVVAFAAHDGSCGLRAEKLQNGRAWRLLAAEWKSAGYVTPLLNGLKSERLNCGMVQVPKGTVELPPHIAELRVASDPMFN